MNDDRDPLRRRIGMGIAVTGALLVAGIGVFGAMSVQARGDRAAAAGDALVEGPPSVSPVPSLAETSAPTPRPSAVETPVVADTGPSPDYPGIDFSRTPSGWYDARTPADAVVIPEYNDFGELNDGIWERQRQITAQCMAEQGFWYAWTNNRALLATRGESMIQTDGSAASDLAEYGTNPSDQPYDWRLAGCGGYAVHVTGMDDAH